jgi:hypothetical protein
MCQFKSGIILKDRVFVPDYDQYSEMLKELKIKDDSREPNFVRAELVPKDRDVFSDIDTWQFQVDQDFRPDWFVLAHDEKRMRDAVKEWAKNHIFIGVDNLALGAKDNAVYYLKDCQAATVNALGSTTVNAFGNTTVGARNNATVKAWNNAIVEAWDNATVKAWNNAIVEAWDNATVKARNNAIVGAWDNAIVEAWDNAKVEARDNAIVVIPNWSSNKRENIVLFDNSTLKDCNKKTIYQSGDWALELVK